MNKLLTTLSQKWPEYLLEILVLIIGIYGAFALEEWNEDRKANATKSSLLDNLKSEFENNLDQIDTVLYYDHGAAESSVALMELMKTKELLIEDTYDSIFLVIQQLWTFDPSLGALRSAIYSEEIQLIKNKKLLNYLFGWEDLVRDAKENEDRFIDYHSQYFQQFTDRIQLANSHKLYDSRIPHSKYKNNYTVLFNDPQFENFLSYKALWIYDAERELLMVRSRIVEILDLLEKE